jgi:hypothetical protein
VQLAIEVWFIFHFIDHKYKWMYCLDYNEFTRSCS